MAENKVFCRFLGKGVTLEKRDDEGVWACKVENKCTHWNERYKDKEVMIAPYNLEEPKIETKTKTKDIVIICRHLMAWRGK